MGLIEKSKLLSSIAPPLDLSLATQLLDEYVSLERRFVLRDWEPAELDGGQFAEVLARIIYHQDSGTLNATRTLDDCLKHIENDAAPHLVEPRHSAIHLGKVLRTIYKLRSQRGAIHITSRYSANHADARLITECVRWCMTETLRLFWSGERESAARAIRELLQFDVPCIGKFEDTLIVQRTDLSAEEEILILLHYAGENGFSRKALGDYARTSGASVTRALQKLTAPGMRQVVQFTSGNYRLTDLGSARVRNELSHALALGA